MLELLSIVAIGAISMVAVTSDEHQIPVTIPTTPFLDGTGLQAQTFQPLSPYGNITPSVETFTMTRYGALVPSLYTGAMTFSVPVYTYSDQDFTVPVSLEYSYDGYKPLAEWIGIGGGTGTT